MTLAHCSACLALTFSIFSSLSGGSKGRLPPPVSVRNYGRRRGGGGSGEWGNVLRKRERLARRFIYFGGVGGVILSIRRSRWMVVVKGDGKPRVERQVKNGKYTCQS